MHRVRRMATSFSHGRVSGRLGSVLGPLIKHPYVLLSGEVGFKAGGKTFAADLAIVDSSQIKEPHKVLPFAPKLLIEVMSLYNYEGEGAEELEEKIRKSFENGTTVIWLIHTGAHKVTNMRGVQVMTGSYQENVPLYVGNEVLPDAGINFKITAKEILE